MKKVRLINTLKGLSVFISVLLMQSLAVILCIMEILYRDFIRNFLIIKV